MATVDEAKSLICEMCRNFYAQGWVSGTGGGMSIKVRIFDDTEHVYKVEDRMECLPYCQAAA